MAEVVVKKIDRKKAGKGGGAKKYGRNRNHGRGCGKVNHCGDYRAREMRGETAKAKRVARAFSRGSKSIGWFINSKGKAQRDR